MTKSDVVKLITLVTVCFPSYLKDMSQEQKQGAVQLWYEFIGDNDQELGYLAIREFLRTRDTLYASDNLPLKVQGLCNRIKNAIKAEFPMTKFQYQPVNEYVEKQRRQRGRLVRAQLRALPPTYGRADSGKYTRMLNEVDDDV